MKFTQTIYSARGDHRLFRNDAGDVSICDNSGVTPDSTDDGPLVVRPGAVVEVTVHNGKPLFIVPVRCTRDDSDSRCWITFGTMRALAAVVAVTFTRSPEFVTMAAAVAFVEGGQA